MKIKRRVIRAIAVSIVCILLAATLLFIGVAADTIELVLASSGQYSVLANTTQRCFIDSTHFAYHSSGKLYVQNGSSLLSTFDITSSTGYDSSKTSSTTYALAYEDGKIYLVTDNKKSSFYISVFVFELGSDFSVVSSNVNYYYYYAGAVGMTYYSTGGSTFSVVDGNIYGFALSRYSYSGSSYYALTPFTLIDGVFTYSEVKKTGISYSTFNFGTFRSSCFFYNGFIFSLVLGTKYNISSETFYSTGISSISGFLYEDILYSVDALNGKLYSYDSSSNSFSDSGSIPVTSATSFFASGSNLYSFLNSSDSSLFYPFEVYSGLPVSDIQIFSADSSGINLLDTIPREGLTSVSAFLGSTDNTSALKATYQDGAVLNFTFDQRFDGYAFGGDAPGLQVYPPVRNVWVDIPIDGLASNLFLLGDYTNGYVTVVDEGWGALVRLNYISPDNYIEFQFFEDSYRITTYSSDGSILYSKYEEESVKRWRLQIDGVWRDWIVYEPELTDYFEIRSTDGVEAVMLDFTYVDSGGGDTSGDESDPETSVPDYSDPLWNGLFSGDPLEESKQNDANSRFDNFNSKAQAEQSLAGDIGGMIPDYSLQVDYAGDIQNQVDKWGSGINGGTSAKDISNWLWSSLGCGAMFSVVMGGVLIRFILQTRA